MIEFSHVGRRIRLESGGFHAVRVERSYHDAPASELQALTVEVEGGTPWREAVRRRYETANPWLTRIVTDPSRGLFFRQFPPAPGAQVLDIGAGWGQIALPLARACEVTALEPTPERLAFIRAAAAQEAVARKMHFLQADFFEIDFATRFDLVACIGVLEWVPAFRPGDPQELQLEFLRRIRGVLAPKGKVVIGIENRLGLKYLLGALDDHLGVAGIAVLPASLAAEQWKARSGKELRCFTYTHHELRQMLAAAGLPNVTFFAALPDYKLPEVILPLGNEVDAFFDNGGFCPESEGYSGTPLTFQSELQAHYRSLAPLKAASALVPSFFAVASAA